MVTEVEANASNSVVPGRAVGSQETRQSSGEVEFVGSSVHLWAVRREVFQRIGRLSRVSRPAIGGAGEAEGMRGRRGPMIVPKAASVPIFA